MARTITRCGNVRTVAKTWKNDAFSALCPVPQRSRDPRKRGRIARPMLAIDAVIDRPGTVLHGRTMVFGTAKDVPWRPYPVDGMGFRAGNRV
ncbi:hypothetical protein [Methylobacterium sp. J-077]|uniref:hypothetical protein n=1 Tax=Methylobacterium sp. J-077 TaxID=2836656 RepID=UPI001FBB1548|nr:hypothetical protein [Methylobacterium sp. J-077]MCJ2127163.1 hypothetical protein [Methylobacterium sp. J-077]